MRHAYHLFAVRVPERRAVYDAMHAAGIGVQVHYVPIYKHSLFADAGRSGADFPETERAYAGLLSLPLYPGLTETDQDRVVEVLTDASGDRSDPGAGGLDPAAGQGAARPGRPAGAGVGRGRGAREQRVFRRGGRRDDALDEDDAVAALASELGAVVVRGPVDDVLTRFLSAVDTVGARPNDVVVRLTADCPLLDPRLIAQCVRTFSPERLDYVTTDHDGTIAHGFDVEVVSVAALRRVDALAHWRRSFARDVVHRGARRGVPGRRFRARALERRPARDARRARRRASCSTRWSPSWVSRANEWRVVVGLLRERPDLVALNAHVGVKPLALG